MIKFYLSIEREILQIEVTEGEEGLSTYVIWHVLKLVRLIVPHLMMFKGGGVLQSNFVQSLENLALLMIETYCGRLYDR